MFFLSLSVLISCIHTLPNTDLKVLNAAFPGVNLELAQSHIFKKTLFSERCFVRYKWNWKVIRC